LTSTTRDYSNIPDEENPFSQLPLIKKALDYLNIPYLEVKNNEADDLIASIVSKCTNEYQYIIVSTDTDFMQLINNNVFLYVPRDKKSVLYNREEVIKKYNVLPEKYIMFKSLVGDKSDNIKGIKGIGNITATKILKYNSIQEFIVNNPNSRFSNILISSKKLITKNRQLIELNKFISTSEIIFNELHNVIYISKTYEIIESIGER
jgi:DNA polymerase-1